MPVILCRKGTNSNEHFIVEKLPDRFVPNDTIPPDVFPGIRRGVYVPTGDVVNGCHVYHFLNYANGGRGYV